jgi:transposase
MDVHAASCTLAVISEKGRKLRDFPVETNGQALVEAIRMIPGHKHLVMEEGLQSAWLYETLSPHVDELVVAGITESRGPKSDKRDAYGLAEKLRVGDLDKPVFKSPRQFTRLRELSRIHMTLVGDVVRAQARIKSLYRSRGIFVTGVNVYGVHHREQWQKQLSSSAQTRATRLYDHLDFLLEQKKQAEADLLREAKKHAIARILETAPGFGPIRAARLVPIVVTPHRFRTKRQFWSYCGLGIVTRSTSDWIQAADGSWIKARVPQTRGLSRQHNHVLKSIFKGAATTVITQVNKDPIICALRAAPRWRHEAVAREGELGAHDRSNGVADVEGREGVRPRTGRSDDRATRRLGEGSIGRIGEKTVLRVRSREQCSHATLCVAAEESIHLFPGRRPTAWRSHV